MPQWLRPLDAVAESLGSGPSTHTAAHNCLQLQFPKIRCPPLVSLGTERLWHTDRHAGTIRTYNKKKKKSFKDATQRKWDSGARAAVTAMLPTLENSFLQSSAGTCQATHEKQQNQENVRSQWLLSAGLTNETNGISTLRR